MSSIVTERALAATAAELAALSFRVETNPVGPAIDLVWTVVPADVGADLELLVLRRERRFPGRNRQGLLPVSAAAEDITDGELVYDSAAFAFDFEETRDELQGELRISTSRQYLYRGSPRDRLLVRTIRREFRADDGQFVRTTMRAVDRSGLAAGRIYYYTAFAGPSRSFSRATQSSALATGRYDYSFFRLLPQVHKQFDTRKPAPTRVARADEGKGQLERLLEALDAHADMLHGLIDGLHDLHHPRRADSRVLPHLARLIGWELKDYLDEDGQRNEVLFAAEFYRTVGTRPNIAAMINRLTGWDTQVREFVRNVLLSFDTARLEELESGQTVYLDGSLAPNPSPPPTLTGRRVPPGSLDTADAAAMFALRNRDFDDQTAYTYDCGRPDPRGGYLRDNDVLYNRETIGVYIVPDIETEPFTLQEEWDRVHQILAEFLPIQVRAVFVVQPGVIVEEEYDATTMVTEELADLGALAQSETWDGGTDERRDRIPQWRWFISNDTDHLTVDTAAAAVNTNSRTWHTGLAQGL